MLKIKAPINMKYPFRSVNRGDIFEFNEKYYMKTETATISTDVNAINLQNGEFTYFEPENLVYLLDGEMALVRRDMSPYKQ